MTKETPRQASVNVTYQKKVKSKKAGGAKKRPASVMAEYNEGFSYTDPASGESDTISITLTNPPGDQGDGGLRGLLCYD